MKKLYLLSIIFICLLGCKISKFVLKDEYTGRTCDDFYAFIREYRSRTSKNEIILLWQKKGYLLSDTTITTNSGRTYFQTRIEGKCDTIEFINFQILEYKKYTKIYFHGICLKNEKKKNKTQNELLKLRKEIEVEFIDEITSK